jgi:hypothetical protein
MSYHDEIRELLGEIDTGSEATSRFFDGSTPVLAQLRTQAEKLLALPEESIDKLVQAAQLGVEAVEIALAVTVPDPGDTGHFHAGTSC